MEPEDFEMLEQLKSRLIKKQLYTQATIIKTAIIELKSTSNQSWTNNIVKKIEDDLDIFGLPSISMWD